MADDTALSEARDLLFSLVDIDEQDDEGKRRDRLVDFHIWLTTQPWRAMTPEAIVEKYMREKEITDHAYR